jgi:hypothetical protein
MHYMCWINYALFSSFVVFFNFLNLCSWFYLWCFSTEFSLQLTCLLFHMNSPFLFCVSFYRNSLTSYFSPTSSYVQFTPSLIYYLDLLLHLHTVFRNSRWCLQSSGSCHFSPHCVHFLLQFWQNISFLVLIILQRALSPYYFPAYCVHFWCPLYCSLQTCFPDEGRLRHRATDD